MTLSKNYEIPYFRLVKKPLQHPLNRKGTSNCLPEALARTPDEDDVLDALQAIVEESTEDFHDP